MDKHNEGILGSEETGFIEYSLYGEDKTLFIDMIYVRPELRSSGIGSSLMAMLEEKAVELGIKKIEGVFAPEEDSIDKLVRFYERNGYRFENREGMYGLEKYIIKYLEAEQ